MIFIVSPLRARRARLLVIARARAGGVGRVARLRRGPYQSRAAGAPAILTPRPPRLERDPPPA
ncbi:MAG TPA: hypothetical protein RMH26_25485, partial [Polyangiaceae bacterium LLY-WYZ-15_(1-7)]|nr:hypothetical protein [Polyangiaceae bacterium LLY-WYZ-15_(1-7)]